MIIKHDVIFPFATEDLNRNMYIYLPDNYNNDSTYPVLYMLDGQNIFYDEDATYGRSWRMASHLGDDIIVVALSSSKGVNNTRTEEYTPHLEPTIPNILDTVNWIINIIMPMINVNYNVYTDKEHTFIGGSSFGALCALYLTLYTNKFGGCIAMSPSLIYTDYMLGIYLQLIANRNLSNVKVYMDYGVLEGKYHEGIFEAINVLMRALVVKNADVIFNIVANGEHCEAHWEERIEEAVDFMLSKDVLKSE